MNYSYLKSSIVYSNLPKQPFPFIETVINHKFCIQSADCPKLKKISFDAETNTPTYLKFINIFCKQLTSIKTSNYKLISNKDIPLFNHPFHQIESLNVNTKICSMDIEGFKENFTLYKIKKLNLLISVMNHYTLSFFRLNYQI